MRVHPRHGVQVCPDQLCEAGLGDAPRALWPSERSVRRDVLRGFMGGDGGRHYGFVELRADLLLHRLRWRHVRDQSVLVLTGVCPKRVRYC